MKKNNKINASSKIALTAALIGAPILMTPSIAFAQTEGNTAIVKSKTKSNQSNDKTYHYHKVEIHDKVSAVGLHNGDVVYKNNKGEYFTLDRKTGDMKFMSSDIFIKIESSAKSSKYIKIDFKNISIKGIDDNGNVISTNSKGENFYIDSKTGDMVFVK